MPITPFLAGQAFDPEAIENMSAAFVAACDALRLKVGDDPATRFVAEKVIEFAHPRSQYALQIDTERIRFDRREPPATNKWHHSEVRDLYSLLWVH